MTSAAAGRPQDWREGRRLRAWELKQQGWTQRLIAAALGVTPGAVSQWMARVRAGGLDGLRRRMAAGPQPKLSAEQRARLPVLLAQGAQAWGLQGGGLDHPPDRRRHRAGLRCALPSVPRQPTVAGDWLESAETHGAGDPARRGGHHCLVPQALAGAQKGAHRTGQTLIGVDESGFYLLPAVVRTYAPRAQTPILHVPLTHDHLSVISGITPDDRLLLMMHERPIRGPEVVRFLQHLLCHIPGKLLVIWDGAPIHHGQAVQAFLAAGGAARFQLEIMPGYAPDLNPDEEFGKLLWSAGHRYAPMMRWSACELTSNECSRLPAQMVPKHMDDSDNLPNARMWSLARHQVAGSGCSTASQVPHRLEALQEPLPRFRSLQPAAVAESITCGHVAALDGLGGLAMGAVQSRSDVPSAWAGGRHGLDVRLVMIGYDLTGDHAGALDGLAKERLGAGRISVLTQEDIHNHAVLVDRPIQVAFLSLAEQEDLIHDGYPDSPVESASGEGQQRTSANVETSAATSPGCVAQAAVY